MKTIKLRKLLVVVMMALTLMATVGFVSTLKTSADTVPYTVEQVVNAETGSFKMATGASVKNSGEAKTAGIRYAVTLSREHYHGLKASVVAGTYESVNFGVFILPKAYNDVYAVRDYAFGDDVKYNWAVMNAETGEWEYTAENGKAQIFNLVGDGMAYYEDLGAMAFCGSVVDMLPENMGRELVGVGYIAYTVDGKTSYVFTDASQEQSNTRTMAYVAQVAIAKGAENPTWLFDTYVQPVIDLGLTFEYSIEYYFGNQKGEYALAEGKTVVLEGLPNETVTVTPSEIAGYTVDSEKSILSGAVLALDGALTLKCYYKQDTLNVVTNEEVQLVEVNETPTLDLLSVYGYDISDYTVTATLTAQNGRVVSVEDVSAIATKEIPQGVYTVELKADSSVVYTAIVDIYNVDDGMVWQEISEYIVNDVSQWYWNDNQLENSATVDGSNLSFVVTKTQSEGLRIRAIHSKEYYEMMSEVYQAITFDISIATGLNIEVFKDNNGNGADDDGDGVWQAKNTTVTYSILVSDLLTNWNTFNNLTDVATGPYADNDVGGYGSSRSMLVSVWYGPGTINISNFGSTLISEPEVVEVADVQLVETATTPTYNLLSLDTESKIDTTKTYSATFTAQNGRVVKVDDASKVDTTAIPQGVYDVVVKNFGITYMTAKVDIYTVDDGCVWQEISEYSSNDARVWRWADTYLGVPTVGTVNNTSALQWTKPSGNYNSGGMRIRAIHSKEYYEMMVETYEYITFDITLQNNGLYIVPCDGVTTTPGTSQSKNTTKTYQVPLQRLIDNWKLNQDIATKSPSGGSTSNTLLFYVYNSGVGETVVSIGNFGSKPINEPEVVEVADVQLVETATTPTYNLLSLDTESKIDTTKTYRATFTAQNGRVITVSDASKVDTTAIPQGVYDVVVKNFGITYMTAKVDIYTAADGCVWQEFSEYSVNDARVWKFQYTDMGTPTYGVVGEMKSLQFTPVVVADANNSNFFGIEVRAIHSKEYYELMSENYESITFDVHVKSGLNVKVNGMTQTYGVWQAKNSTVTYTLSLATLLEKWDNVNVVTEANNVFKLFDTFYSDYDTNVISVGNFGSVAKTAE